MTMRQGTFVCFCGSICLSGATLVVESWSPVLFYVGLVLAYYFAMAWAASWRFGWIAVVAGPIGIFYALLMLPVPVVWKTYGASRLAPAESDDNPKAKHPPVVKELTMLLETDRRRLAINRSRSVIALDIGEGAPAEKALSDRLFATLGQATAAARQAGLKILPSADMVDAVGKHFDDEQMEAIERASHSGDAILPGGKQGFLVAMLRELQNGAPGPGTDYAIQTLAAALLLGGGQPALPPAQLAKSVQLAQEFTQSPRSVPTGIYSSSKLLASIFRRDRFLHQPWRIPAHDDLLTCLASALSRNSALRGEYLTWRRLDELLTARSVEPGLEVALDGARLFADDRHRSFAFWPASGRPEQRLFDRLYRFRAPDAGEMMAELVMAIRAGKASLGPDIDSGWYDHQLYAPETQLLPDHAQEATKLALTARYKKRLRRLVEAMVAKRRETHVKWECLMAFTGGSSGLEMAPELAVEPMATCYLRTARAYRFVESKLNAVLRPEAMARIPTRTPGLSLGRAFLRMARRFYGLYLVVCEDLGMVPELRPGEIPLQTGTSTGTPSASSPTIAHLPELSLTEQVDRRNLLGATRAWLATLATDPAVAEDQRAAVPVTELPDGRWRCWATLGVRLRNLTARYAVLPQVERIGSNETVESLGPRLFQYPGDLTITKTTAEYMIPVTEFRELTLGSRPPTAQEFRRACDEVATVDATLTKLAESLGHTSFARP